MSVSFGIRDEIAVLLALWNGRPMLDEDEFGTVSKLYTEAFSGSGTIEARFTPMLDAYERLTGWHETNPAAVMHHRLSQYGPPCHSCGKPLRTPVAALRRVRRGEKYMTAQAAA
jgi:hypothetical protein